MPPQYLYVICEQSDGPRPVKIGFSAEPNKRLKQLQTGHSSPLVLFHKEEVPFENVRALEKLIHKELKHHKARGEWFQISPEDAVLEIKHALIRYGDIENLPDVLRSGNI